MKVAVDLHMHSVLSPCGEENMTPNNIVNMARLKGLDVIAVTDHNSCDNVSAVMQVAKDHLLVLPGMEIQTREEIHLLCYFKAIEDLHRFDEGVRGHMTTLLNTPDIFGHQWIMDIQDEIVGERKESLLTSLDYSLEEAVDAVHACLGTVIPAHVNRPSYSILSQLGFIPPDLPITMIEFSQNYPFVSSQFPGYAFITSSDAHELSSILEREVLWDLSSLTIIEIFNYLKGIYSY